MPVRVCQPGGTTLPSALRLRRLTLGLLQSDVARAAGLSRNQVIQLEAGRSVPRWPTAHALAEVLGCEPRDIFPAQNDHDPEASRAVEKTTGEAVEDACSG
jgi:DNA-binding XRE family transcriptional regulator